MLNPDQIESLDLQIQSLENSGYDSLFLVSYVSQEDFEKAKAEDPNAHYGDMTFEAFQERSNYFTEKTDKIHLVPLTYNEILEYCSENTAYYRSELAQRKANGTVNKPYYKVVRGNPTLFLAKNFTIELYLNIWHVKMADDRRFKKNYKRKTKEILLEWAYSFPSPDDIPSEAQQMARTLIDSDANPKLMKELNV